MAEKRIRLNAAEALAVQKNWGKERSNMVSNTGNSRIDNVNRKTSYSVDHNFQAFHASQVS